MSQNEIDLTAVPYKGTADALHLAASHACREMLTFDDRGYVRRAAKLGRKPAVKLAAA